MHISLLKCIAEQQGVHREVESEVCMEICKELRYNFGAGKEQQTGIGKLIE